MKCTGASSDGTACRSWFGPPVVFELGLTPAREVVPAGWLDSAATSARRKLNPRSSVWRHADPHSWLPLITDARSVRILVAWECKAEYALQQSHPPLHIQAFFFYLHFQLISPTAPNS